MGTTITFRRGENDPTSGSGLTLAEPAFNTTLKTFHIGLGYGVTAAWVGAPISGLSADIAAGITYKIPTAAAVKNYINGLCFGNTGGGAVSSVSGSGNGVLVSPTTGAVVVSNTGVHSFNGSTGAVQGVSSLNGFTGAITISGGTGISLGSSSNSITVNTTVLPTDTFALGRKHLLMGGTTNGNSSLLADNNLVYVPSTRILGGKTSLSVSGLNANYGQVNTIILSGSTTAGIDVYTATNTTTLRVGAEGDFTKLAFETGNEEDQIETFTGTITFADYLTDVRTYYLPNASGTIALTSQLMGAVNGSTAATTTVTSFNGLTGAVGGVCAAQANTFTALQSFANGISASGITVNGNMSVTGNFTVSGGVTFTTSETVLIEDNIITLNSNVTGSPSENAGIEIERGTSANVQLLWNESSDKWTFTNDGSTYYDLPTSVVTSFNGLTGAVTGASLGANTFTGLNSFNAGISSYGGTFSDLVRFTSGLSASDVRTLNLSGNGTLSPSFTDGQFRLNQLASYTTVAASGSTDRTITLPDDSGTVALTSQLMGAINGSTAATTAVTSFNGRTGSVQGVSAAVAGTGISVSGATGAVTITNIGVQSFNGATGAVTGASLGANTFTGTQTLTAGLTTSYLYASTGSTFASTLQVNGGATFSGRVDVGGNIKVVGDTQLGDTSTDSLTVFAGTTFNNRTDFAGNNNFATGLTAAGTLNTTSNIKFNGTTAKSIQSTQAPLTIKGMTSGGSIGGYNAVVLGVQITDPLQLYSTTGVVDITTGVDVSNPYSTSIRLNTGGGDFGASPASISIEPITAFTAGRTLSIQDASGTIALTSQLMGAINGSTAATTAVTSFNGRTGAVQGVSAAAAGDGIAVSGATGAVTITNTGVTRAVAGTGISVSGATGSVTFTNTGVQTFNGATGAVTGASLGANTFTALNTFNAGISASALTVSGGVTFSGNVYLGDAATGVTADSNDKVNILAGGNYKSGIYRSYKTLTASTSGVVCTTPADNAVNTVNTFEVTLEYYQTGFVPAVAVHKFWIAVTYGSSGTISDFDYTESIVKGSFTTLVPFTISTHSSGYSLNITAAAPANTGKFYSGWVFLSTVRVY